MPGSKTVYGFSIILIWKEYDVLKSKSPCILLNKNIVFNKNKTKPKMENPKLVLERRTLCFSSYKYRKLKAKLWWVGAHKRKKEAFFVPFIFSEGKFFKICVLSQFIVYWIHFQKIHTFTYQKTLLHKLLLLVLEIVESLQCILNLFLKSVHAALNFAIIINWFLSRFKQKLIRFLTKFLLYCVECLCRE